MSLPFFSRNSLEKKIGKLFKISGFVSLVLFLILFLLVFFSSAYSFFGSNGESLFYFDCYGIGYIIFRLFFGINSLFFILAIPTFFVIIIIYFIFLIKKIKGERKVRVKKIIYITMVPIILYLLFFSLSISSFVYFSRGHTISENIEISEELMLKS